MAKPAKPSVKKSAVKASAETTSVNIPQPAGKAAVKRAAAAKGELVVLTGLSGAGKLSALKTFEDLGFYAVDNLPLELIPQFADLVRGSNEIKRAVLGVDVREGLIDKFPAILQQVRKVLPTSVVFLEASDDVLVRRYSETRRPHPLRRDELVSESIAAERKRMEPIRNVADVLLDTSRFNVHELRAHINAQFSRKKGEQTLLLSTMSFGFKNGVPPEADLVFDVRFLPNPHFIPEFRPLTGRDAEVSAYVMGFPQTKEFLDRTTDMLKFLLPHYVAEGKSYLTIAFGCTGGQHRSVALAEEMKKRLTEAGYRAKVSHRDMPR
ncbi:putative P-loop-containing kinase [Terriglobus roseus DSM 18391]|uniref:Putative P-loop-containing kinase n=1 Tax=Terriglobus roseus (strain DSM 18391 / NRRL B-41598 / KBS 63) TaxID=926566 RepID=I3ZIC6_TERRK|nr:RNase adapter RapZ [Terriglobus roseus]AFL88994.1 putative P-loop-containing kinase [Terriglobus roseus DSM 18391]